MEENPFSLDTPENEELYIDDPKKALKGYFEREGTLFGICYNGGSRISPLEGGANT